MNRFAAVALALVFSAGVLSAAETSPLSKTGIKNLQLVTALEAVTFGETFTVGLLIEPEPGFHTYWKGPGSVGVATSIEWTLPEGFTAGPLLWPPPEVTDMAGIRANGYRSETILLTDISVPDEIASKKITIHAKVAWMACSTSCHPGLAELELSLPVNHSGKTETANKEYQTRFESIRKSVPSPAPKSWSFHVSLPAEDRIEISAKIPEIASSDTGGIHFFSYDHQVDSDEPQELAAVDVGQFILKLPRPDFAPSQPNELSGVLYNPDGWPGTNSKWVEISVPWPEGTFNDE